mmetsp:Transcript_5678/g.9604  ORF Transcript_5678/g.9604 Transcript_5678/m.9604 type:complete len:330 (+) Transcript_5678:233-1222(+)
MNISPKKPSQPPRLTPPTLLFSDALLELAVGIAQEVQQEGIGIEINLVAALANNVGNIPSGIDPSQLHKARIALHGRADQFGTLGLSPCLGNDGLLLLKRSDDHVLGPLGLLLGHLLALDGPGVFGGEGQMGDGHVLQHHVESRRTERQLPGDVGTDLRSLGKELVGVVPGDDGLGHLVHEGGQDALVVVHAEVLVDPHQITGLGLVQHTDADGDHLQILAARQGLEVARPGADVVNVRPLEPRDVEVQSLAVDLALHAGDAVEHHGAVTALDGVHGIVRAVAQRGGTDQRSGRRSGGLGGSSAAASRGHAAAGSALRHRLGQPLHRLL